MLKPKTKEGKLVRGSEENQGPIRYAVRYSINHGAEIIKDRIIFYGAIFTPEGPYRQSLNTGGSCRRVRPIRYSNSTSGRHRHFREIKEIYTMLKLICNCNTRLTSSIRSSHLYYLQHFTSFQKIPYAR